jgi:PBP1b-binding outer membrane lipoprotein LpoB
MNRYQSLAVLAIGALMLAGCKPKDSTTDETAAPPPTGRGACIA